MGTLLGFMAVPSYSVALVLLLASSGSTANSPVAPYVNLGTVAAVQQLLARQLPGAQSHFSLAINTTGCAGGVQAPCFEISDIDGGGTRVSGIRRCGARIRCWLLPSRALQHGGRLEARRWIQHVHSSHMA